MGIHDALCVIRCLVKKRFLIAGGGAPETELFLELMLHANSLAGADAYCFKQFADAMEVIPYTLAENAGLNPISTVTELRNRHAQGGKRCAAAPRVHQLHHPRLRDCEKYPQDRRYS